jgi:hypothetical protein
LVGADDLLPIGKAKPAARAKAATAPKKDETTERKTPEDIDKAEEEYLKSLSARQEENN